MDRKIGSEIVKMTAWMAGSLACYVILVLSIRHLSSSLGTYEIALLRNLGGTAICLFVLRREASLARTIAELPLREHGARALIHAGGAIAMLWAVSYLPLGAVSTLEFSGPIFAMLIGAILFRERIGASAVAASCFILCGIATIMTMGGSAFDPRLAVPILATAMLTASNLILKRHAATAAIPVILLVMNVIQIPIFAVGAYANGSFDRIPEITLTAVPAIVALAFAGLGNQACIGRASRHGTSVQLTTLDTFRIPMLMIVGYLAFAEKVDAALAIGALLVAVGSIAITVARSETSKKNPSLQPAE